MNIYVGNLSYSVTEDDLRQAFEAFGQVASVSIIKDKFSNQSKGFGFVEMPNEEIAEKAITELNGAELDGRTIVVNKSEPKAQEKRSFDRRPSFGGGGGGRRPEGGNRPDGNRRFDRNFNSNSRGGGGGDRRDNNRDRGYNRYE